MKKNLLLMLAALMLLLPVKAFAIDVFGDRLLLAGGESYDPGVLQYDARERLVMIDFNEERYLFDYTPGVWTEGLGTPFAYDVRMTVCRVGHEGSVSESATILYRLGDNGFAQVARRVGSWADPYQSEVSFTYDSDGHMTAFDNKIYSNYSGKLTWQDGDIVSITYTCDDNTGYDPGLSSRMSRSTAEDGTEVVTFSYGQEPVENKGRLMLYDEMFACELGVMGYAYFAGILGQATRHLPVCIIWHDSDGDFSMKRTWTLDTEGYPTRYVEVEEDYEDEPYIWDFFWMDRTLSPAPTATQTAGSTVISWRPVAGAEQYELTVFEADGNQFGQWQTDSEGNLIEDEPDEVGPGFSALPAGRAATRIAVTVGQLDETMSYTYSIVAKGASARPVGAWHFVLSPISGITGAVEAPRGVVRTYTLQGVEVKSGSLVPGVYIVTDGATSRKITVR